MSQSITSQEPLTQLICDATKMQNPIVFLIKLLPLIEEVGLQNLRVATRNNEAQFIVSVCKNSFVSQEVQKALLISLIYFGASPLSCLNQAIEWGEEDPKTYLPAPLSQRQLDCISYILQIAQYQKIDIDAWFPLSASSFYPEEGRGSVLHLAILRLQASTVQLLLSQKELTLAQEDSHGHDAVAIFQTAVSSLKDLTEKYPHLDRWILYQDRFRETLDAMDLPPEQAKPLMETINSLVN